MNYMNQEVAVTTLADEILEGLLSFPKHIPSKYFYDDEGSLIFTRIMRMPEYYLTDSEYEIFDVHKREILDLIKLDDEKFDLIELGAGDGFKTNVLIRYFLSQKADFQYMPVDISDRALESLELRMKNTYSQIDINAIAGDYFHVLNDLNFNSPHRKVVLFLGSNIGNYYHEESLNFLRRVSENLDPGDILITGFDLVKDPGIILQAYNDPHGYTEAFNLNLLHRMNRELGANFDPDKFMHYPFYDAGTAMAKSYLVSKKDQQVYFDAFLRTVNFVEWEPVFTEVSRKFTFPVIEEMANKTGFKMIRNFTDSRKYFANSLWMKEQ